MALTDFAPNTVYLGGGEGPGGEDGYTPENNIAAGVAITPGMLVEVYSDSGVPKFRPHTTADLAAERAFALEYLPLNRGIADVYAIGDLPLVGYMRLGAKVYAIVPSGQNIAVGAKLQSNGDGKLKALASGEAVAKALEATGAVTADTRVRVQIM